MAELFQQVDRRNMGVLGRGDPSSSRLSGFEVEDQAAFHFDPFAGHQPATCLGEDLPAIFRQQSEEQPFPTSIRRAAMSDQSRRNDLRVIAHE